MFLVPEFLFQGIEDATRAKVFGWWESRRLRYNLLVGIVGLVTWLLVLIAGSAAVKPGVDFEEPIAMIFGPFIYGLMANICYTFGPVFDVVRYRRSPRVGLFKAGLIFSIVLTALPGLWAVIAWLITVFTGKKLD
jgi:hypothetical protein